MDNGGDVLRRLNDEEIEVEDLKFGPENLADLIGLIDGGERLAIILARKS